MIVEAQASSPVQINLSTDLNSARTPEPENQNAAGTPQPESAGQLNEDQTLAFLKGTEVTVESLSQLARNADALKSRKVVLALVSHPRTPRHASIPLLRRMFTFDLMQVTLTPAVAADIKRVAEEQIIVRIASLSAGEKISLARRASGRVAAVLLRDSDPRVVLTAL
ncbi:MAG TPA: hypothetical protein VFB00_03640, partial [Terriglobales bacterium]|nr:hypothetical protein [Terriglobales bacterium]